MTARDSVGPRLPTSALWRLYERGATVTGLPYLVALGMTDRVADLIRDPSFPTSSSASRYGPRAAEVTW